mmetsp:Transcript_10448/g.17859  ORF Transcript_10448/g.17859 Transcript_10448/m.17859 type:complete len:428 (+) Transcript_10448:37-1320(+)
MASMVSSEGHKLANDWTFWTSSMRGAPELKRHEQFDSIEAFWELFAKHRFSDMPDRTSIHVFKDDIQPLWEDPKNLCGGHFKLIAKSQHTTESAWLDVVLNLIGEQFPHRDLVNGASVLANRSGNSLVKIWISIVKKPVVQALRQFIRAALKEADYLAGDVRLVPHKLVVKGAGKKIPGACNEETAPASKVSACGSPAAPPSCSSSWGSSRSSSLDPTVPLDLQHNSTHRNVYTRLLLAAPTVGGPLNVKALDVSGAFLSERSVETCSASGGALSFLTSCASSEVTPRHVHKPYGDDMQWVCGGGLSTPPSIVGSDTEYSSAAHSPRSAVSDDRSDEGAPVEGRIAAPLTPWWSTAGFQSRPRSHRRICSTQMYSFLERLDMPQCGAVIEWEDSPAETHEHSWSTETHRYRHEPYSLLASLVPVSEC